MTLATRLGGDSFFLFPPLTRNWAPTADDQKLKTEGRFEMRISMLHDNVRRNAS